MHQQVSARHCEGAQEPSLQVLKSELPEATEMTTNEEILCRQTTGEEKYKVVKFNVKNIFYLLALLVRSRDIFSFPVLHEDVAAS